MTTDFFSIANSSITKLSPYVPGKPMEDLARELGLHKIIKLASNENPLACSEKVKESLNQSYKKIARYPDGAALMLKDALAEYHQVDSNMITVGNGSNEMFELLAKGFLNVKSNAVFSQYAFAVYPLITQSVGAESIEVPALNWQHDLIKIAKAITDSTRLVFLANPNNPTGSYFSHQDLETFLKNVKSDVIVVLDEAYYDYVEKEDYPDGILLQKQYSNLVITRTFSKAYGLAALRMGYAIANPEITEILNRVRQPFNVNSFAQNAAIVALQDQHFVEKSRKLNSESLSYFESTLSQLKIPYIPSIANFISISLGKNASTYYQKLLHEGVIVRPLACYNMPEHLRVTTGTMEESEFFTQALIKVLAS